MKKSFLCAGAVVLFVLVCLTVVQIPSTDEPKYDIIRIHIRANSNSEADQNVKFKVKDAVVAYLEPKLSQAVSRAEAETIAAQELSSLNTVAESVLNGEGFSYTCRAKLEKEEFPTRSYDGIVFENGVYSALILELGTGGGNNWWCVMYPPLCFMNAENIGTDYVEYHSLIQEWLKKRNQN